MGHTVAYALARLSRHDEVIIGDKGLRKSCFRAIRTNFIVRRLNSRVFCAPQKQFCDLCNIAYISAIAGVAMSACII